MTAPYTARAAAFAAALPLGSRRCAALPVSGRQCPELTPTPAARSLAAPHRAFAAARMQQRPASDEGFVNCSGCGADAPVSLARFALDGAAQVRCSECGRRWRAPAADVFMLDASANIVPAVSSGGAAAGAGADARGNDGNARIGGIVPTVKLYVGGLGPKVTKEALKTAFEEFGDVSNVSIICDRVTGRSRGFAFVTVANASAAEAAIADLNATSRLGGRRLTVKLATDF